MNTSDLTNMPVAEKLKLVEKLWDEIAASNEPIVLPPEVLSEIAQRSDEVDADPSILIDDDEMWRRVDG
jgi:putative addiction module component (TIGR02574 family)